MNTRWTLLLTILFAFAGYITVQAQGGVEALHKSTKKYITPVYMHKSSIKEQARVSKYMNLEQVDFPAIVGKIMIDDWQIPYEKDWELALSKSKTPNKVIANLFTENNSWTFDELLERARNDMTDADYQQFKSSAAGIRAGAGRKFYNAVLQSNFIMVYTVSDVHTQEEAYNRIDKANRERAIKESKDPTIPVDKKYKFEPVKRTRMGYHASLYSRMYRIDMNDEDIANFENHIFGENGDNTDDQMFKQLVTFDFKLKRVHLGSEHISSTLEKKKANNSHNADYFIKNMLRKNYFNELINGAVKGGEDFQLTTTIYDTDNGIEAKVGTKEGIKRNSRFFVYEMRQKRNGKLKKKRMGAIRAKKPSKNEGLATGETMPTKFYQITGRRLGKGMILEEKKAMTNLSLGYGNTGIYAGINKYVSWANATAIGFDYNGYTQARLDTVYIKTRTFSLYLEKEFHVVPNVSVGADAGLFYELTFFSDTLISEELGVPNQDENLNLRLGASANIYITPNYKLFGRYQFLPGKYGDETTFAMEGPYKIERFRHRYYFGIVFVL